MAACLACACRPPVDASTARQQCRAPPTAPQAVTFATFAPKVLANQGPADRSFGPFTPAAELTNGRVAQIGFAALLVVELFKQAPLF